MRTATFSAAPKAIAPLSTSPTCRLEPRPPSPSWSTARRPAMAITPAVLRRRRCASILRGPSTTALPALTALSDLQGKLGLQEQQLNDEKSVHTATLNIAQNGIGNIVRVDQATAITQLQTLETQIQASFSATSQIQKLSLVNFIG